jgi:HSP20 family protein
MATYRPAGVEDQFSRMLERMVEDFFAPVSQGASPARWAEDGTISPRVNVSEDEKSFQIQAELPGAKKEDVKVSIDNQRVTIEAETRQEEQKREGENMLYAERSTRKFVRSFMLPADVDDSTAEARLENGVLTLILPKKQGGESKRLPVQ